MTEKNESELNIREKLAHIDLMLAEHDRKRQEIRHAPLQMIIAGAVAIAAVAGFLGYKLGQVPPQPIIIQQMPAGRS